MTCIGYSSFIKEPKYAAEWIWEIYLSLNYEVNLFCAKFEM